MIWENMGSIYYMDVVISVKVKIVLQENDDHAI